MKFIIKDLLEYSRAGSNTEALSLIDCNQLIQEVNSLLEEAITEKNALIEVEDTMFEHVYNVVVSQKIKTISGEMVPLRANTFCIHGDNPNAVQLVKSLVGKLQSKGIKIR